MMSKTKGNAVILAVEAYVAGLARRAKLKAQTTRNEESIGNAEATLKLAAGNQAVSYRAKNGETVIVNNMQRFEELTVLPPGPTAIPDPQPSWNETAAKTATELLAKGDLDGARRVLTSDKDRGVAPPPTDEEETLVIDFPAPRDEKPSAKASVDAMRLIYAFGNASYRVGKGISGSHNDRRRDQKYALAHLTEYVKHLENMVAARL